MQVSVVIPTHNRPEMLAEAIASVRAQTFTDYEIVVVSNGESEETRSASRDVATSTVYIELGDGNVSAARNAGAECAKGEWIAFLDDDDLWLPTKLERQVAEAQRTGADMIACDYVEFYPDGRELIRQPRLFEGWPYVKALSHQYWWAAPSGVMVRKAVFKQAGGFDPGQRSCEDNDMWRRISWRHTIHQVEEVLFRYRQSPAGLCADKRTCYRYDLRHFHKMRHDTPPDLRWALPSATIFVPLRLVGIFGPDWLVSPLRQFRPRLRWIEFRQWLKPRTRVRALLRVMLQTRYRGA
jgi:glycosyltransferase involved in cell wall biosynthesis